MGRYSDTNVEKSAILLLKIKQNGIPSQGMVVRDVATGGSGRRV